MKATFESKAETFSSKFFARSSFHRQRCKNLMDLINKYRIWQHEQQVFKKINKAGRLKQYDAIIKELGLSNKQTELILETSGQIKIPLNIMANKASELRRLELMIRKKEKQQLTAFKETYPDNTVLFTDDTSEKIRIQFQIRPKYEQKQELIEAGFIYSTADMCWTKKQTSENIEIAKKIINRYL